MATEMTRTEKINFLQELKEKGIIQEDCPVPVADGRGTAYWRFEVLKPGLLPQSLRKEYRQLGELRW